MTGWTLKEGAHLTPEETNELDNLLHRVERFMNVYGVTSASVHPRSGTHLQIKKDIGLPCDCWEVKCTT